jgi:mannan endo-1,4-beta-mannosidase
MMNSSNFRHLFRVAALALLAAGLSGYSPAPPIHRSTMNETYAPADPKATRPVRALLNYLNDQRGKGLISGQTDLPDAEWVKANTGKYPAILNLDFMHAPKRMGGQTKDTEAAIEWFRKRGGLVSYQWHWSSPSGASDPGSGFYTKSTKFDLATALANPDSHDYQALLEDIDDVAGELAKMQAAGVPVLFRPLHEAQGTWFWWGAKGAENCKALYHLIFERMTKKHQLHNIAWVWTAYPESNQKGDPAAWYPGDHCVDVVVSDYCEKKQDFDDLTNLTNGKKMVALAETMNAPAPDRILPDLPWAYWTTWARRDWSKNSNDDMKRAMASPTTITLDKLPDVTKW